MEKLTIGRIGKDEWRIYINIGIGQKDSETSIHETDYVYKEIRKGNIKPFKVWCKLNGYRIVGVTFFFKNQFRAIRRGDQEDIEALKYVINKAGLK